MLRRFLSFQLSQCHTNVYASTQTIHLTCICVSTYSSSIISEKIHKQFSNSWEIQVLFFNCLKDKAKKSKVQSSTNVIRIGVPDGENLGCTAGHDSCKKRLINLHVEFGVLGDQLTIWESQIIQAKCLQNTVWYNRVLLQLQSGYTYTRRVSNKCKFSSGDTNGQILWSSPTRVALLSHDQKIFLPISVKGDKMGQKVKSFLLMLNPS
jgi:hypothetical protein